MVVERVSGHSESDIQSIGEISADIRIQLAALAAPEVTDKTSYAFCSLG